MEVVLSALFSFPALPFTALMAVALVYWLLVILGALDLDIFHLGGDGHNPFALLEFLRVGQVPVSIILSLIIFIAWALTLAMTMFVKPLVGGGGLWWLLAVLGFIVALGCAVVVTGFICRPMARLFAFSSAHDATSLIGRMVEITSSTVDTTFGTARHERSGGEELLLNVVCDVNHVGALQRGAQAVIMEYERSSGVYTVAPLPHTRPDFISESLPTPPASPPAPAVAEPAPLNPAPLNPAPLNPAPPVAARPPLAQ